MLEKSLLGTIAMRLSSTRKWTSPQKRKLYHILILRPDVLFPPFKAYVTVSIKEKTAKSRGTFSGSTASDSRSHTHPLAQPRSTARLLQEHHPWDLVVLTAEFSGIFVLSDN